MRGTYAFLLALTAVAFGAASACGAGDGASIESSESNGPNETNEEGNGETGESEPTCEWQPAVDEGCWPMVASQNPEPDLDGLSFAGPVGGSLGFDAGQLRVAARWWYSYSPVGQITEVLHYYREDVGVWSVFGIEAGGFDPHISTSNAATSWAGGFLWLESGGVIVRTEASTDPPRFVQVAARSELSTIFATSRWGPNPDTLWSINDGCLRQAWWRPDCDSDVYQAKITLAADGRLFMVDGREQLHVNVFDVDGIDTIMTLGGPGSDSFSPGDIVVDSTSEIHICYRRPNTDGLTYGHGHSATDWEEVTLDTGGVYVGYDCRLAVSNDASSVWLSSPGAVAQVKGPPANAPSELPANLVVFDIEIAVNEQPIILAAFGEGPADLALGRLDAGDWVFEVIDGGE